MRQRRLRRVVCRIRNMLLRFATLSDSTGRLNFDFPVSFTSSVCKESREDMTGRELRKWSRQEGNEWKKQRTEERWFWRRLAGED